MKIAPAFQNKDDKSLEYWLDRISTHEDSVESVSLLKSILSKNFRKLNIDSTWLIQYPECFNFSELRVDMAIFNTIINNIEPLYVFQYKQYYRDVAKYIVSEYDHDLTVKIITHTYNFPDISEFNDDLLNQIFDEIFDMKLLKLESSIDKLMFRSFMSLVRKIPFSNGNEESDLAKKLKQSLEHFKELFSKIKYQYSYERDIIIEKLMMKYFSFDTETNNADEFKQWAFIIRLYLIGKQKHEIKAFSINDIMQNYLKNHDLIAKNLSDFLIEIPDDEIFDVLRVLNLDLFLLVINVILKRSNTNTKFVTQAHRINKMIYDAGGIDVVKRIYDPQPTNMENL